MKKRTFATKKTKPAPKQTTVTVTNRHVAIVAIGVALVVGTFFVMNGPYWVKRVYGGYKLRQVYKSQLSYLREPLNSLGFQHIKDASSHCGMTEFFGYEGKQFFCSASQRPTIAITESSKVSVNLAAKQLDDLINLAGGVVTSNAAPTFQKWFAAVTEGADFYPDVHGTIRTGTYLCDVGAWVAYSNPSPPAVSVELTCNRPSYGDSVLAL